MVDYLFKLLIKPYRQFVRERIHVLQQMALKKETEFVPVVQRYPVHSLYDRMEARRIATQSDRIQDGDVRPVRLRYSVRNVDVAIEHSRACNPFRPELDRKSTR